MPATRRTCQESRQQKRVQSEFQEIASQVLSQSHQRDEPLSESVSDVRGLFGCIYTGEGEPNKRLMCRDVPRIL